MALQSHKFAAFLSWHKLTRCISLGLRSVSQLSTLGASEICVNYNEPLETIITNKPNIDESKVLDQLSDLLPIRCNSSILDFCREELDRRPVDNFLLPEEKLRGIFLQKLKGKALVEGALTSVGVDLDIDVVSKVVNRGNMGAQPMVMFFNWAVEQPNILKNVDTYNIILKALGRRKFFEHMMEMLQEMRNQSVSPNSVTLLTVLDSFVRARRVAKATQIFGQLDEFFGLKCDTKVFNILLQCLCKRSHIGFANSLLGKMKEKVQFDSNTYNIIIGAWARSGAITEIGRSLKAMMADGFDPDNLTYSYVIEGLGRAGQIDEAVVIFENLKERQSVADTGIFNAMISNFVSIGDLDRCLKYYECMLNSNCEPNIDTYVKIISAFLKARRVADAIEIFDEMLNQGIAPSTGSITSFLEPLCSYGPPHAALMIYERARKVGCVISSTAYKLLLKRLSIFGKCGMMFNVWNDMQKNGYSCDVEVYEHIVNGLCNIGQLENAVLVMEECLGNGFCPSKLICSKLNNKLLTSNRVEMAYKLYLKIKRARCNENARTYWRAKGWHF